MTGAKDPDCRRGMLWDEARQDKQMLQWYRSLIRVRREHPAVTRGSLVREDAWDGEALIRITRELEGERITLVFHASQKALMLPELAGRTDLITGREFDGRISGITALALKEPSAE